MSLASQAATPAKTADFYILTLIDRFEAAWQRGEPLPVREFLNSLDTLADTPVGMSKGVLARELVKVDLEYRWRSARGGDRAPECADRDRCPTVEDYAAECPELGACDELPTDLIAEEYRVRQRWGDRPPREAFLIRFPKQADSLMTLLTAIDAELACAAFESKPPNPGETTVGLESEFGGHDNGGPASGSERFRILRPHARGGLGAVVVALDGELNREVALKRIQERYADQPESRARFVREAEITGGLEHPGIVPVYSLGRDATGRPFYAMRLVKGESLKQAIADYHSCADRLDPGARKLAFQKLLRRFLDVCNAVDYAHSRGVLHRDLKPGNIMLGKYGETLVVDWGVAKASESTSETVSDERPLTLAAASGLQTTQVGTSIGTPQFMSPEQAAGALDELEATTDVYSLGATLYCLLTGRVPIEGSDLVAVLERVRRGEFRAPRQVKPRVPRALESICMKAMALKPADRYQSPRALADEIEHWLADEPVSAHREGIGERLGRWTRRHRAATQVAALALVVLAVVATGAALLVNRARIAERNAKNEAQALFAKARATVNEYLTAISDTALRRDLPGLQEFRSELLKKALVYYQDLLNGHPDDPALQWDFAEAYLRVGHVASQVGNHSESLKAYDGARRVLEAMARADPSETKFQRDLATAYNQLGLVQKATGRFADAEQSYMRARAIQEWLVLRNPAVARFRADLASTYGNLGILQYTTGRSADAERSFNRALELEEKIVAQDPGNAEFQSDLAGNCNNLGNLQNLTGRRADAERSYNRAREIREKLVAQDPRQTQWQNNLASTCNNLGALQHTTDRPAEAEQSFNRAREIRERLVDQNPSVTEFESNLANTYRSLGNVQSDTGRPADAERMVNKAREIWEKLVAKNPRAVEFQDSLAYAYYSLASLRAEMGRPADGQSMLNQAREIWERLIAQNPRDVELESVLGHTCHKLGVLQRASGQSADAERSFTRARDLRATLAAQNPSVTEYQENFAVVCNDLGPLQCAAGRLDEAERTFNQARETREKLVAQHPNEVKFQSGLADLYHNLGLVQSSAGRSADAAQSFNRAREIREKLLARNPADAAAQKEFVGSLVILARILATSSAAEVRDGKRAVSLATTACELTEWKYLPALDTLAAAYAEAGDFDSAVKWQTRAIERAPDNKKDNLPSRLELYQQRQPYREPAKTPSGH
jgi:serine/threonine-protein kinase